MQRENGVENCNGPIRSSNISYSSLWKQLKTAGVVTCPPYVLHSAALPAFTNRGQSANQQKLSNALTDCRKNFVVLPEKNGAQNSTFGRFFDDFVTGQHPRNETLYRQLKMPSESTCFLHFPQNFMNFGSQTATNRTFVFTHPPEMLHSGSLPAFGQRYH